LRQEREKNGKFAQAIEEAIVGGYIVPVEITLGLLAEAMNEKVGGTEYGAAIFLIDGFPRNFDNLNGWYTFMRDKACTMGLLVINCPVEELERRILSRGETSGRSDDNIASARKRFATFESQTVPVIRLLQETDFSLDGSIDYQIAGDRTEDEVWNDTKEAMDQLVLNDVLSANQRLLDAISQYDCTTYLDLIDPTMLLPPLDEKSHHDPMTEGEIQHAIQILEYDRGHNISEQKVNLLSNVQADIMGINAVVSYDRVILNDERNKVISRMRETRVWHHSKKGWLNVHFVRRPLQQNESSRNFDTMAE
jgi:UMP-CMP kinase